MPSIVLQPRQVLRHKNQPKKAMETFDAIPAGCAYRDGDEVIILRPVEMTFTELPNFKTVAGSASKTASSPREQAT